jgi:hypothetical protein
VVKVTVSCKLNVAAPTLAPMHRKGRKPRWGETTWFAAPLSGFLTRPGCRAPGQRAPDATRQPGRRDPAGELRPPSCMSLLRKEGGGRRGHRARSTSSTATRATRCPSGRSRAPTHRCCARCERRPAGKTEKMRCERSQSRKREIEINVWVFFCFAPFLF